MLKQTLPFFGVEALWVPHPRRCWPGGSLGTTTREILVHTHSVTLGSSSAAVMGGLGNKSTRRDHSSALGLTSSPFKLKAFVVGAG